MINKLSLRFCFLFLFSLLLSGNIQSQDQNWTHFRGSNLDGISATKDIPLKWDASSTKWKTEIRGKGYSSPAIWGNQIWVTTASEDGKDLSALCLDFKTGKVIYDIKYSLPKQ